jgi:hypothetical protein
MLKEVNEVYGLGLCENPDLGREQDPSPLHDTGRTVLVGSSHMKRIADHMSTMTDIVDLSVPGWTAEKESISALDAELKKLQITGGDTVVVDLLSNSTYMGTDDDGIPARPVRSAEDGKYHVLGELQIAPESALRKTLKDCQPIFDAMKEAKKIVVLPFPRYLAGKCCTDVNHITNFGDESYEDEVLRVSVAVRAAYNSAKPCGFFMLYSLSDTDLLIAAENRPLGGENAIWRDPVHFQPDVYSSIAADLVDQIAEATKGEGGADQHPNKRRRIDSVAPPVVCVAPRARGRSLLPAWLMGRAAGFEQRGRGDGRRPSAGGYRGRGHAHRARGGHGRYSWFGIGSRSLNRGGGYRGRGR